MKTLHILNGHSTLHLFEKSTIAGETYVWPEILCEGKCVKQIGSDDFWDTRGAFHNSYSDEPFDERLKQIKEEMAVLDLEKFEEIVLWFEYDLFCQINLLGALSWLHQKQAHQGSQISLVCLGEHANFDRLVALGEIKAEEYPDLLEHRQKLSPDDLAFADHMWEIYCSNNHDQLVSHASNGHSRTFPYLKAALEKHQRRFPDLDSGLIEIEKLILQHLQDKEGSSRRQLVGHMLRTQEVYGFGDLQYFDYLEGLHPLITEKDEKLSLNETGINVLHGQQDFMRLRPRNINFGGASLNDFRYHNQKLLKHPFA